jgi:LysM repeat protein
MIAKYTLFILIIVGLLQFASPGTSHGATNWTERMEGPTTIPALRSQESVLEKIGTGPAAAVKCPSVYVVRYGETLYSIAARCGTNAAALMRANGLRSARVWPGQRLYIPAVKSTRTP